MSGHSHSASGVFQGDWNEAALRKFATGLRERLGDNRVTFGLLFTTPAMFEHAQELLELVRVHAHVPVLAGCSSHGLISGGREIEGGEGVVLGLYSIPGATVRPFRIGAHAGENRQPPPIDETERADVTGWIAFLDPFHTDAERWIESWQDAHPGAPVFGGLAAGRPGETRTQVYCDGEVIEEGGVALAFSRVRLMGMVAQGCTPVGETWTITRTEGNIVHRIGNRPAVAVLEETFEELDDNSKRRSRGNLFAGLAVDEYRDVHQRGDFLVRQLVGADRNSGALAVAATARQGQTIQFQLRDAQAADEEIRRLLEKLRSEVARSHVYGGCLCVCSGRGRALFGEPDHDAALVRETIGLADVTGFFCNGEFGPVGPRSFVHGYTASLVLFVGSPRTAEDDL